MKPATTGLVTAALLLLAAGYVHGKNVDLSTVPDRDTVQLTIYNSEDLTLVRETRKVSFKKGEANFSRHCIYILFTNFSFTSNFFNRLL